jgi:phage terminase large subunit-like protein
MTSRLAVRRGSQVPRVLARPRFVNETAGQEAIELAESVGLILDPWQQLVVRVALAEDERGLYAARELGFLVARQNGKGGVLEAIALHGMFLVGDPLTLWTAHQTKTAFEGFLRLRSWIDGSDDLRKRVHRVNAAHGDEGFTLKSGARLRFLARSKSSGRGFSPQRILFDEAQELSKLAVEAMLPSMRAQANRQAIYTGTVPGPEINNPEHWMRLRDRGRESAKNGTAADGRTAWLEWTPVGSDDPDVADSIDLLDPVNQAAANPSLGVDRGTALSLESLEADIEGLSDDSARRECFSIWPSMPELDMDAAFGKGAWQACEVEAPAEPPVPAAIGLGVTPNRDWGSIAAAGDLDGRTHLGAVDRRAGAAWMVDEALRIQKAHDCAVVLAAGSPAESLKQALEDAGVDLTVLSTAAYMGACASVYDDVNDKTVSHSNYDELNAAVGSAEQQAVGDRFRWARRAGDVAMLEAATCAAEGARTAATYDVLDSIF